MIKRKNFELNKNNTTQQNECDTAKVVFGEKFVMLNAYVRKEEKSKINYLSFPIKQPN